MFEKHSPALTLQRQDPLKSELQSLSSRQTSQLLKSKLQLPLRQSTFRSQFLPLPQAGQFGPPQSIDDSPLFLMPSLQVALGGGGGPGGETGGDGGGEAGGEAVHAPGVAPCLSSFPFWLFFTETVCPFRQSVTFFFFCFFAVALGLLARPMAPAMSAPNSVRRGVELAQRRVMRSKP